MIPLPTPIARMDRVLPDKLPTRDLREAAIRACTVARKLIERTDSRGFKPTPGPWWVMTGCVYAGPKSPEAPQDTVLE